MSDFLNGFLLGRVSSTTREPQGPRIPLTFDDLKEIGKILAFSASVTAGALLIGFPLLSYFLFGRWEWIWEM